MQEEFHSAQQQPTLQESAETLTSSLKTQQFKILQTLYLLNPMKLVYWILDAQRLQSPTHQAKHWQLSHSSFQAVQQHKHHLHVFISTKQVSLGRLQEYHL